MAGGNGHNLHLLFTRPPERTVSLVPSMTQSLFDLDCAHMLAGVTAFCPQPEGAPAIEVVGGTHAVDVEKIVGLKPDLVLANQEENDRHDVEALEAAGIKVWVSFPRNVAEAIKILWATARVFGVMKTATPKILLIERSLEWVLRGTESSHPKSVFVPIWQESSPDTGTYWMTFNKDTYCDSVLSTCGGRNVFSDRLRRYPLQAEFDEGVGEDPGDRDTRYPRVGLEEVVEAAPQVILLPSEPFEFNADHRKFIERALAEVPAVKNRRVFEVDGRWLAWHGTMLAHAIAELPAFLD